MKLPLLASLIASAAAFAPASQVSRSSAVNAFEQELGAQDPLGFYDPLGLVADGDEAKFNRLRYVELKHGRISMLAFLGQIVTRAGIHLPGSIDLEGNSFDSYPDGLAAISGPDAIPQAGLGQIFLFVGLLELFVMKDVTGNGEFPGDFRNGFDFGWDDFGPKTQTRKRGIELNNGRAAMMGILGLMMHEQIEGNPVIGVFLEY
uniref:Plastid light harvesting protein n=1 Tax=Craspedostauros australis TaxID=1486917 RepID=A0A7R9ZSV2_9STRA|eukprot:CAMPEP_0198115358 /NCGR_PEP_ID=MMETSP1442-20131203/6492_1 /TAXON_ID= /ORGANISM="Craspedostauros australis, Strain CCMP3328" /LENGTH=203 /DNA_ID=CAMNT_0043772861 /DNA_START=16 /DNA_END=627 /DNA_ORIENTATION=+